ncbi:MAG: phosphomannomutase [Candidatus Saccharimonadales bacterium]
MARVSESLDYTPVELSFGTSGLRGLVSGMTDMECYINTLGFLRFLSEQQDLPTDSVVYVAGDLRDSTPRIISAVVAAITNNGYRADFCGFIPTPALANFGLRHNSPSIMVTGSHIPADRNGIKFYKLGGEILKSDETAIKAAVAHERQKIMTSDIAESPFNSHGMLVTQLQLPCINEAAAVSYQERYKSVFDDQPLTGKQVVVYQHSAVGRDMIVDLLTQLGAHVIPVGRSEVFIPIDTENVTLADQAYFLSLAKTYSDAFAIVSTDGDSDRPFVIDERGIFHRGDELGAVVATWLGADFAAIPVSSSDAVDQYLGEQSIEYEHTCIGSPYVIVAMQQALAVGKHQTVGWEVNGGFLLGSDLTVRGCTLLALPTRDAFLPIIVALMSASEQATSVSALFSELPARFTQAGLIDNFPVETSRAMINAFSTNTNENYVALKAYFSDVDGYGKIIKIDSLDGVRIFFNNGDIAHLRPSGNAPQLRIYSVADSQQRADRIIAMAIAEPHGVLRQIGAAL